MVVVESVDASFCVVDKRRAGSQAYSSDGIYTNVVVLLVLVVVVVLLLPVVLIMVVGLLLPSSSSFAGAIMIFLLITKWKVSIIYIRLYNTYHIPFIHAVYLRGCWCTNSPHD